MTEVNFRDIPPPRYPEDELSGEPWYSVSPGDVFPEEFRHWLCADPRIGPLFEEMHADLFVPATGVGCKRGSKRACGRCVRLPPQAAVLHPV